MFRYDCGEGFYYNGMLFKTMLKHGNGCTE